MFQVALTFIVSSYCLAINLKSLSSFFTCECYACVSAKWLVLTNWLLGCSTSLSLAPALVTLSQDPRSHNPARDFGDSLRVMTFMTGVRNIIIIRPGDILEVRVIRGSELTNERLHQRRLMSRLTFCSVSVSRLNTLTSAISEWLSASKYSRCITDLLFTLYRNPASQPHKHHNSEKRFHSYHQISKLCKYFCIIEFIFQNGSLYLVGAGI